MYQDNTSHVIGAATTSAVGVAALPATGGNIIFTIAAYAAIGIGVVALLLQAGVSAYRFYARRH